MNIIVTNKYKDLIYNTGIEVLKELNGVFKVSQIVNSFNSIFYKKIIIDATALENFPKDTVLQELAKSFDMDKLILFLPPDNPPPKNFLSFLISLNIYNFTDNPNGLLELINKSNTIEDVQNFKVEEPEISSVDNNQNLNDYEDTPGKVILGIRGITDDMYSTRLTYMFKKTLETVYSKTVYALEINKNDFVFFNEKDMYTLSMNQLNNFLGTHLNYDVLLVDLDHIDVDIKCDDEIYLVNPSIYYVNKLLFKDHDAFIKLKGKKVVFVDSLLKEQEVNQFAKEANISVYYNLKPINDRVHNEEISKLLNKLGIIVENNKPVKKGLFDIFK